MKQHFILSDFGRRSLDEHEILRLVKERYRICGYVFKLAGFWMLVAVAAFVTTLFVSDSSVFWIYALVVLIAVVLFTLGFALTLAIYRCPVCDKYLSRFRPDTFRCPQCNARIRESST